MADGNARQIKLRISIDQDGLPLAIKRATDAITKSFDDAAGKIEKSFDVAAIEIIKSIRQISRTNLIDIAPARAALAQLTAQLADVERRAINVRRTAAASIAAVAGGGMPIVPTPTSPTRTPSGSPIAPVPLAAAGGSPPRQPPTTFTSAASPAPGGNGQPPRVPASVTLMQRANTIANQTTTAARITGSIANGLPPSAGANVSRLAGLYDVLERAVGNTSRTIGRVPAVLEKVAIGFAGLGSAVYVFRTLGQAVDTFLIRPIGRLSDQFIEAVENSRRFELALSGTVGGQRARALNYELTRLSQGQPAAVLDLRQTGQTFAALPALAGKLNDKDAAAQIIGLNRTVSRLATLDPAQGQQGATIALREVLEGGGTGEAFTSLRRRFGLSAATLSRAIGETVDNVKADPALALKAVEKITSVLIPDSVVDASGELFTVKIQKLRDSFDQALVRIGDSGVYDRLTSRVNRGVQAAFAAIDSEKFTAQARKISDAAERAIGSITTSADKFLRKVAGGRADQPLLEVAGDAIASGITRLANALDSLPAVAETIGTAVGNVTAQLGRFVDAVTDIAEVARRPELVGERLTGYAARRVGSAALNTDLGALGNAGGRTAVGVLEWIRTRGETPAPANTSAPIAAAAASQNQLENSVFGEMLRKLDSADGTVNFGSTLLGASAAFGRLEDITRTDPSRIESIAGAGRGAFAASGQTVDRLQEQFTRSLDAIEAALVDGAKRLQAATDPAEIAQLRGGLESIRNSRDKLVAGFEEAGTTAAESLTEAAQGFRRGLANELVNLPLAGGAALTAATGRNAQIDNAQGKLAALGFAGGSTELSSWQLRDQQTFLSRLSDRQLGDVQAQSVTGRISIGMTPKQIEAAASARPDDRAIQQQQASLIRDRLMPAQRDILNNANDALAAAPGSASATRDAASAAAEYAKLASELDRVTESLDNVKIGFREFAASVREGIENGLGDIFYKLSTGADDLKSTFRDLVDQILRDFLDLQSRQLVQGLFGDAGKPQQSGEAGGVGGIFGAILGGFMMGLGGGATPVAAAANGAIFPGGFQAFASGGIARHPTLGLIGERSDRTPEAVIPMLGQGTTIPLLMDRAGRISARLPGGRSIPATMENHTRAFANGGVTSMWEGRSPMHTSGGGFQPQPVQVFDQGGTAPDIYVVSDMEAAVRAGMRKNHDIIVSAVSGNIAKGGVIGKAVRR